jgi:phage gpG-like protein
MITLTFDQKQLKMLKAKLDPAKFSSAIQVAMARIGFEMQTDGVRDAPYDTGNLRRSISTELGKTDVKVGSDLVYARIQDLGGSTKRGTIKGKRYLTGALEKQSKGRAVKTLQAEFNKLFR